MFDDSQHAAMAQSVERILGKDEVTGSIPVSSFFLCSFFEFDDTPVVRYKLLEYEYAEIIFGLVKFSL